MPQLLIDLPEPCDSCHASAASVGAGREAHRAALRCVCCGKPRGWINLAVATFAAALAAKPGAPDAIKIRAVDWTPPGAPPR
jgi:hypothetical protein